MKMKVSIFKCSHCNIEILVFEAKVETMLVCNCGRWMGHIRREYVELKSRGKIAGDFAIKKEERRLNE